MNAFTWSEPQAARLRAEWQAAQRAFAYHPTVGISAVPGEPPSQFRVMLRVHSLIVDQAGELQYTDSASADISIPRGYPLQAPVVRLSAALFHPNISQNTVHLSDWRPGDTLVELIGRVGEMIAWRSYDPEAVTDESALQWMHDNAALLPLDSAADFAPGAGGEPLERILRYGPTTLDQMRGAIDELLVALAGEAAGPTLEQVRKFAQQAHAAMRLFLDPDLPAELQRRAAELARIATELPASIPTWDHLRRIKTWAAQTLAESRELSNARAQLAAELQTCASLVTSSFDSPQSAIALLPSSKALGSSLLSIPRLAKETSACAKQLQFQISALESMQAPPTPQLTSPLAARLAKATRDAQDDVAFAQHSANAALENGEKFLSTSQGEALALRVIGKWREYFDTLAIADAMTNSLRQASADAIDGYFIKAPDGQYGPFQFEEVVQLGRTRLFASRGEAGAIELRNAEDQSALGRGAKGSVTAMVPLGDGQPVSMVFTSGPASEQPLVQLDYAIRETSVLLPKLQSVGISNARSWCGRMLNFFSDGDAQQQMRDEHRHAVHRWESLLEDLKGISSFKARLITYFLLERISANIADLLTKRSASQARLAQAEQRLAAITAKSGRDPQGQLIVPGKLAKSYAEETTAEQAAKKDLSRIDARLKPLVARVREHIASPRRCGRPEVPHLRKLSRISEELGQVALLASDENLQALVSNLAATLQTSLLLNLPPAPPPPAHPPGNETAGSVTIGAREPQIVGEAAVTDAVAHAAPPEEATAVITEEVRHADVATTGHATRENLSEDHAPHAQSVPEDSEVPPDSEAASETPTGDAEPELVSTHNEQPATASDDFFAIDDEEPAGEDVVDWAEHEES